MRYFLLLFLQFEYDVIFTSTLIKWETEHVCVFSSLLPGCFSSFPFFFGQEAVKLR